MTAVRSQLPPQNVPLVDEQGRVSPAWWQFLNGQWLRTGGFDDAVWFAITQAMASITVINSLNQTLEAAQDTIAELRAMLAAQPKYDDKIDELRVQVAAAQQTYDTILQQQEVIRQENDANAATALAINFQNYYSSVSQLGGQQQQIASLTTTVIPEGTNLYYLDGRARAALSASAPLSYNAVTGAFSITLATVATSGAYADLTGKPTLGTAAAENIGTSGATVPLLSTANTWSLAQTAPSFRVGSNQVVTSRQTGWTAATGSATRSTFDTTTVTLPVLAEHVKALIDDLTTHGLIGT